MERSFWDSLVWEPHELWYQSPLVEPWCGLQLGWETIQVQELMGLQCLESLSGCYMKRLYQCCLSVLWKWMFHLARNVSPTQYCKTKSIFFFSGFLKKQYLFIWSVVDLQGCVSFRCTTKLFNDTYVNRIIW